MFPHSSYQALVLLFLFLTTSFSLHAKNSNTHSQTTSDQAQQLNYLINLQNNYASGVKSMTDETKNLKLKIQQASSIDEKVRLLESGITKQRSRIRDLNSKLLPDPSSDFSECQTLPPDQMLALNNQIGQIKQNIQQFQSLIQISTPEIKTTQSTEEIRKMKEKISSIEKVIQRQCEQNVIKSAVVYQTNLYQNNNWILGTMTMDQLIDQFYRRSLDNNNITNCPLDRPFLKTFSTYNSDSLCIKCPSETPYFDMSAKNCVACPAGKQMNVTLRNCAIVPKNSLYSDTGRYRIQPLSSIPAPDPKLEYCPSNNPYFNGTDCVSCPGDTYWQISLSKCYACPAYSFFNLATRQCQLYPTIYVNGSRDRLLATDKTSIADYDKMLKQSVAKNPNYRPLNCTGNGSYAAVNSCIICNPDNFQYFNVETLVCTYCDGYPDQTTNKCKAKIYYYPNFSAPNLLFNTSDYNTSKAKADADYKTNPNTTGYCGINTPYPKISRLECMNCTADAPLYLVQEYKCTKCPTPLGYDPVSRTCRPVLYLTDIYNNVVITPPSTLQDYITAEANLNKTNLTQRCPADKPNTVDAITCFSCLPQAPYFNLSSKFCVNCPPDSQYSTDKKGCFRVNYLTDLNASRLLQVDNYTVANVSKQQQALKSDPSKPLYAICPTNTPYGTMYGCVNCTDNTYFNLKSKSCDPCPQYFTYWPSTRKCAQQQNITNISAAKKIVQTSNSTLAAYTAEIQDIKKQGPYLECPAERPYSINGTCVACNDPNSYFLLSIRNCGPCDNFQPDSQTCPPKPYRYSNLSNHRWLTNDGNADRIINLTYQQKKNATGSKCPAFYNERTRDCVNCQQNYYYNFDTGECERCTNNTIFDLNIHKCSFAEAVGTYYTNIGSAQNSQLIYGGLTFDELNKTQTRDRLKYPNSAFCPADRPYYDDISCIKCPSYKKYFNLRYNLCQVCLTNQVLSDHNCVTGNTVIWEQPVPEHVYPFLFASL